MDSSIRFRFVTSTFWEDYRVYYDGGRRTLSEKSGFRPLRQVGRIDSKEGPSASLFEDREYIYLIASSMDRGKNDSRGRPLKFSFCEIFGRDEKAAAWAAFMRVVLEWENAEKAMQEDIEDIDTPEGEGVRFNEENFTAWLQEKKNDSVKFLHNYDADQWLPDELEKNPAWPYDGYILKWTMYGERLDAGGRDIPNLVVLAEKGTVSDILPSENDNDEESARKINWTAILLIGLTIAIIGGLIIIGPEEAVKYIKNLLSVPAENPSVSTKSISGILSDKLREYGNDIKPYDRVTIENIIDDYRRGKIPFDSLAGEIVRELEENSDARLKEGSLVIIAEALSKLQSAHINVSVSEQKISQRNIHSIRKKLSTMLEAAKSPKLDKIRGCWVIGSRSNVEALKRKIDSLYV